MSVQLLDKTRKINRLLHNNNSSKVVFNDICSVLSGVLESNVIITSKKGKVLGIGKYDKVDSLNELIANKVGNVFDALLNERLLGILSTKENVNLETLGFALEKVKSYKAIITPIEIAGERFGTMFAYRKDSQYTIDDIILSEYGSTVVGLEMMRSVNEESEESSRKVQMAESAINTLSTSEYDAIKKVLLRMKGKQSDTLIASRIADETGITRSIIVNALKKFESAGIIECKSAGMKGTSIRILNQVIFCQLGI